MEEVLRNQESQGQGETLNFGVMSFSPNFSRIKPTAQDLRMRFGLDSPTYSIAISELKKLWEAVKDEPDVQRKQELWASSMEVVYGSKPDIKTFIDHTYLATLAKLVVFLMLNGDNAVDQDVLKTVLTDEYFAKHGISNLTEGDFFTWIAHPKILHKALALFYGIIQGLALYDLTQINEDFFKELYQDIVERGTRHKRGEYYTPEWLAELLLRDAIEEWRRRGGKGFPSILDPACGSGTFLVNAIFKAKEELKREGKTPEQILDFILNNIVGTDINPLAAVIARANYLLALGDLLRHRNGSIVIPIYVTDALRQSPITDLLSHKFDVVIGNPPWLTMHDVNSKEYQDFLKKLALEYELLSTKEPHLFSQIEMATLFFDRAADIYLKDNGVIAFVMPKSVLTGAMQHIKFKEFKKPLMQLLKVYDFADVKPLFNVHSIALMAVKGGETHYPVPMDIYRGRLTDRNAKLIEAEAELTVEKGQYEPPVFPSMHSYYYDKVKEGADLIPRPVWFIDFVSSDPSRPIVKSSEEELKVVKERWEAVKLEGPVESNFIYATLLSKDILPFGHLPFRPVVLPIEPVTNGYRVLDTETLRKMGYNYMANWLEEAEKHWKAHATERAKEQLKSILNRFNYYNKLTPQNPSTRFVVIYNAGGRNIVSCVVDKQSLGKFPIEIVPRGFIVDYTLFFYETNDENEAHYLSAVLNSNVINQAIKSYQDERHINKRPFMLPIPRYNPNNPIHLELAKLNKISHDKVSNIMLTSRNIVMLRKEVREALKNEISKIDELVSKILPNTVILASPIET